MTTVQIPGFVPDVRAPGQCVMGIELHPGEVQNRAWTLDDNHRLIQCPLDLSTAGFLAMRRSLLRSWYREIWHHEASAAILGYETIPHELSVGVWHRLAAAGNYAWRQLLGAVVDRDLRSLFRDYVYQNHDRTLLFVCDAAFPWRAMFARKGKGRDEHGHAILDEVIRDENIPGDVDTGSSIQVNHVEEFRKGFIGMSHVVDHSMPIAPKTARNRGTHVTVGVSRAAAALVHGPQAERVTFEKLRTALAGRDDLAMTEATIERQFLKAVTRDAQALIYTFCHGTLLPADDAVAIQELNFTGIGFDGMELRRWIDNATRGAGLSTSPIAFVNACQGGLFSGDDPEGIVHALRRSGAGSTVGCLVEAPAIFAEAFGLEVISRLCENRTLSVSVFEATRELANRTEHPFGLAYMTVDGRAACLPSRDEGGAP